MPKPTFFNLPENKLNAVLEAAFDEFSSNDYEKASIATIVKTSGIARGSFYQYFENKEDLYSYVLDIVLKERFDYIMQSGFDSMNMTSDLSMKKLLEKGILFDFSNPRYNKIFHRAMFGNSSVRDIAVKRMKETSHTHIRRQVMNGLENGSIRSDVSVDLIIYLLNLIMSDILNYVNDNQLLSVENQNEQDPGQPDTSKLISIISDLSNIIENGIKA